MKRHNAFLTALVAGALTAGAVPAQRVYRPFVQPDGTTVQAMLIGDEFGHYYLSEDHKPMITDASGVLRYATVDASGALATSPMAATDPDKRSADAKAFVAGADMDKVAGKIYELSAGKRQLLDGDGMRRAPEHKAKEYPQQGIGLFTSNYPRTGEVRSLVMLVEYQDVKFTTSDPHEYFTAQLNEADFARDGSTGSARDYFLDQSEGLFQPTFDVVGPVTLPYNMEYYGANSPYTGADIRPEQMVVHAAKILAPDLDFSQYDFDNDGYVDNIYVIYAGLGEASGGSANTVWPHTYTVKSGPSYNGKRIKNYACSNEITSGRPTGIGTFCHEYSHVLGLPDLYSTGGGYMTCTPLEWDVMDQGSYNNDGRTPPNYSSFELNALGWMKPTIVKGPDSAVLEPFANSRAAYLVQTENDMEFFMLENRQRIGWDRYLPGHGMLIWHIDFNQSIWDSNIVNNTLKHQYVDIVEAGNTTGTSSYTWATYPFPGTRKVTSFTAQTTPAFVDWSGTPIDYPLTDIKESADGIITFDIAGGAIEVNAPAAPTLTATEQGRIIAQWQAVDNARTYDIWAYTKDSEGNPQTLADYKDFPVGNVTTYEIEGAKGLTEYFVRVRSCNNRIVSDYSEESSVTTPMLSFAYSTPEAIGCNFDGNTAILQWNALSGAASYLVTVECQMPNPNKSMTLDFGKPTDSQLTIPEGWVWSGLGTDCYTSSSAGFFGNSAPSLKIDKDKATLESPMFENDIRQISFWLRGASASIKSKLDVQGRADNQAEWTSIKNFAPLNNYNKAGSVQTIVVPEGVLQLRMLYTHGGGAAVVDDIEVLYNGIDYNKIADRADAGNALTYSIELPAESNGLRFSVEGVDASGVMSRRSNVFTASKNGSSVGSIDAGAPLVSVDGRTIAYRGRQGDIVNVYTLSGATVATLKAASDGQATVDVEGGSLYIVATPAGAAKIFVK